MVPSGPAGRRRSGAGPPARRAGRPGHEAPRRRRDRPAERVARFAFIDAGPGTRFEIGSITKALTGRLLAEAVGHGELSLDTTIGGITGSDDATGFATITMQELCTHTSGLPRLPRTPMAGRALAHVVLGVDPYRRITPAQMLRAARHQRLAHRGRYRYSNLGASVLGQLLAVAPATDFASRLHDRVLAPMGMGDSFVASRGHSAAWGWSAGGRRRQPWIADGYAPAGGVVSTIEDMARLATALLSGSAPGGDALRPIEGAETDRAGRATGMFWVIDPGPGPAGPVIWHNGQTGGYSSFLALYPSAQRAVVVLADTAGAARTQRIALGLAGTPPS